MKWLTTPRATALVGLFATGALSLGIGALIADDSASVRALLSDRDVAQGRLDRVVGERNRLRAERDRLEAQLAAANPRPLCAEQFLSSGNLLPLFTVDYPCGWHVVHDPRMPSDRPGLLVELVLLARVPLSFAPRAGSLGDVEMLQWTDDPAENGDRLLPVARWVDEERAGMSERTTDDRFEGGGGITVHRLAGTVTLEDESVKAIVLLWEYADTTSGARHVVRVAALSPNPQTRGAVERLARSFRVRPR